MFINDNRFNKSYALYCPIWCLASPTIPKEPPLNRDKFFRMESLTTRNPLDAHLSDPSLTSIKIFLVKPIVLCCMVIWGLIFLCFRVVLYKCESEELSLTRATLYKSTWLASTQTLCLDFSIVHFTNQFALKDEFGRMIQTNFYIFLLSLHFWDSSKEF